MLAEWGLTALAETTELVVSELVTNALRASVGLPERHLGLPTGTGRHRTEATNTMQDGQTTPRRRARQETKRSRTIRFDLSERELGEIRAAAEQAGLAKGAFVAQAALAVVRGGGLPPDSPHRQALSEFIRAAGLVRRIGVNLNRGERS